MRLLKKTVCLVLSLVLITAAAVSVRAETIVYNGYKLKTTWITPEMFEQAVNTLISHADEPAGSRMPLYDTGIVCPEGLSERAFGIMMLQLLPVDVMAHYDSCGFEEIYCVSEDIINEEEHNINHVKSLEYGSSYPTGSPSLRVGYLSGQNPAEQAEILKNCMANVKAIVAAAPQTEDPMTKVQFFFEHLCRNVSYGSTDQTDNYHSGNALVKGTAVCSGYASALWLLSLYSGIDATFVSIDSLNHASVAYPKDGRYVFVDATWGDRRSWIDYARFCMQVSDEWNSYLLDPDWCPEQPAAAPYAK